MAAGKVKTAMIPQRSPKPKLMIKQIVPMLDNGHSYADSETERYRNKIEYLESENQRLRDENAFLHEELEKQNEKYEDRIKLMQAELSEIKRAVALVVDQGDDNSSSPTSSSSSLPTTPKLVDVTNTTTSSSYKYSNITKSLRKCMTYNSIEVKKEEFAGAVEATVSPVCNADEVQEPSEAFVGVIGRFRTPRVPKPPPRPSNFSSMSSIHSSNHVSSSIIPSPPPPPPPPVMTKQRAPPPPPPPPPRPLLAIKEPRPPQPANGLKAVPPAPKPPSGFKAGSMKVRRVPEVVEFYHSLMRRDSGFRRDSGGGAADAQAVGANAKDMIGEIENRSAHLLAIKRDVETQGDFIRFLIKEVEGAEFTDIEDVLPFVKWLDDELSYLVDERAVLKHFDWPEQKADALREAAFGYSDLKKLVSEASLFRYDPRQPCCSSLKKMQSLFEKLEHGVYNLSRMRESATKRYKVLQIPVNWMMDTGYVSQIKLASVKLAMKYMKRVLAELEIVGGGPEEEELIVQGVKFAFRVHQFAGGFDTETMRVFQELRKNAQLCSVQWHNQHQEKLICRSSTAC